MTRVGCIARASWLVVLLVACGDGPAELDAGVDAGGLDAGAGMDAGPPGMDAGPEEPDAGPLSIDAGPPGSDAGPTCATLRCDDGIGCTLDTCTDAVCSHEARDADCPAGAYCDPMAGCTGGEPCLTDAECPPGPGGCFPTSRCDPATRVCVFPPLDGDADGHAPMVCGGMDCDDGNPGIFPGAPELCDGVDQDCDMVPDAPLAPTACRADQACVAGACACAAGEMECSGVCRDLSTDDDACGDCRTRCVGNRACVSGACACSPPFTDCFGSCVDLMSDDRACGACGFRCPSGATCTGGACVCPAGEVECPPFGCVSLSSPSHCGACGNRCETGAACVAGACVPSVTWAAIYNQSSTSGSPSIMHYLEYAPSGALIGAGVINRSYYAEGTTTVAYPGGPIYVSSHDDMGALSWAISISRSSSGSGPTIHALAVAGDGSIFLVVRGGGIMQVSSGGSFSLSGFGSRYAVVKLSSTGTFVWAQQVQFGTTARDLSLAASASGVALTGYVGASVTAGTTTLPATPGERWGFVVLFDSAGAVRTFTRVPGRLSGAAFRGASLRLAGTFRGTEDFSGTSLTSIGGLYDLYFAALDPATGTLSSAVTVGSARDESINAVEFLDGGDAVVATNVAPLARYRPSGALVWLRPTTAVLTGLTHDASDRLIATRSFSTPAIVRYRSDGTDDLELQINRGRPYAAAVRGSRIGVAGTFDGTFRFGPFSGGVRFTPGLFTATVEAP